MTDRTYPTAAEAREAAFRIGAEGGCRADALRRAIERAQQAAVREALEPLHCEWMVEVPCWTLERDRSKWCDRCTRLRDAERALDALEEVGSGEGAA